MLKHISEYFPSLLARITDTLAASQAAKDDATRAKEWRKHINAIEFEMGRVHTVWGEPKDSNLTDKDGNAIEP